eukprot:NODE_42_length_29671_cov_0.584810.p17 type:complete len:131 gc:universal NODE_42_length_29671_cov_0.584810:22090-22482(+)
MYSEPHNTDSKYMHLLKNTTGNGSDVAYDDPFRIKEFAEIYAYAYQWYSRFKKLEYPDNYDSLSENRDYQVNLARSSLRNKWHKHININATLSKSEKSDVSKRYFRVHRWVKPFDTVMKYTKSDGEIYMF